MAGHEWDWFQREELIGQISDIRVQNLQVERENVQKRTFTRWINLHLEKCSEPLEVNDLFIDIQDGKVLLALLEVLTGQALLNEFKSSSHRIFRLNNIAKALKFLEDSNVKLVSIDAAEIADGNPSLVLGLIWNIILFLQIKELTGNLNRMSSSCSLSSLPSGSDSDVSHPSTPSTEKSMSVSIKDQRRAIKALLIWVQQRTRKYGVAVQDFGSSWRSGLAFLAVIKAIDSSLVDIRKALERSSRENLEDAFSIAHRHLSIPRLLEPEDLMVNSPDEQSIMTYVTQFLEHFPELADDFTEENYLPVESSFVHYTDGPREEEGTIITVIKNEDIDIDDIQPPVTPPEIYHYAEQVNTDFSLNSYENGNDFTRPPEEYKQTILLEGEDKKKFHKVSGGKKPSPYNSLLSGENAWPGYLNIDEKTEDRSFRLLGNPAERLLLTNGKDTNNHLDFLNKSPTVSVSDVPEEHTPNHTVNGFNTKSPDLSSMKDMCTGSDKDPILLINKSIDDKHLQTIEHLDKEHLHEPSTVSDNADPLCPWKTNTEADLEMYVLHQSKNVPDGENPKQMTMFQAYTASMVTPEDRDKHEGHLPQSMSDMGEQHLPPGTAEEMGSVDSAGSAKVSVIPHNLFYYPHYSVPIADVLHAFADACPVVSEGNRLVSSSSPENQKDDAECINDEENLLLPANKTTNMIPLENTDDHVPGVGDTILVEKHPQIETANNTTSQRPASGKRTRNSTTDPGVTGDTQSDVIGGGKGALEDTHMKGPDGFRCTKADLEEDFLVMEDRVAKLTADLEEENLSDPWFSRDDQRDGSLYHRRQEMVPDRTDSGASREKNVAGERVIENKTNGYHGMCPPEGISGQSSGPLFPDIFYIAFLLWISLYFVLILPQFDISKVTFFSSNK
ncbi:calmin [Rhinophrynus dorsalis]